MSASPAVRVSPTLLRAVGTLALIAAIINIIVGGGIFRLPTSVAEVLGPAAPLGFIVGAIVMIPTTLCFAAAGSRVDSAGGPYAYVTTAFGSLAGFVCGAILWICNLGSGSGVAVAFTDQIARWFPVLNERPARAAFLIGLYTLLITLNAFGVKLGARAILAVSTIKLTPLFVLAGVGLFFVDWGQIDLLALPSWGALASVMLWVIFAYSGVETALTISGEVRDARRAVPRAALVATLLVMLLYVGIQTVTQGVLGASIKGNTTPLASAAGAIWAPGMTLLLITATVSMLGFLMGNLLGTSRLVYALGHDGHLPAVLGRVTERYRVPLGAVIAHGVIACSLAIYGDFDFLVKVSTGSNCLVYIAVSAAAWWLQHRGRSDDRTLNLPGGPLIPLMSALAMAAVFATLQTSEWGAIAIALALLFVAYGARRWFATGASA